MSNLLDHLKTIEQQMKEQDLSQEEREALQAGLDRLRLTYQEHYPEAVKWVEDHVNRVNPSHQESFQGGLAIGMEISNGLIESLKVVIGLINNGDIDSVERLMDIFGHMFEKYSVMSEAVVDVVWADNKQMGDYLDIDIVAVNHRGDH